MDIIELIDQEIDSTSKSGQSVNVRILNMGNGIFKGFLPFRISGDYVLNSREIKDCPVTVEYQEDHVLIELDSEKENITAFLTKDEASLLRAVKERLTSDKLSVVPSFIVGPPGTGKTKVITKFLENTCKSGLRVLVLSSTNMAVENVFERIDTTGMEDGDIVLTIKTDDEELKEFSPESIKRKKVKHIMDELEILKMVQKEMLKRKQEIEPILEAKASTNDAINVKIDNAKKALLKLKKEHKTTQKEFEEISNRMKMLTGNSFLKNVAEMFMEKKVEELKIDLEKTQKLKELSEKEMALIEKTLSEAEDEKSSFKEELLVVKEEIQEAKNSYYKINERIKKLHKEIENLNSLNIYDTAKIVGATLIGAALNQRIQKGEFDKIIVDESSMALLPYLFVAAQALNGEKVKKNNYRDEPSLYEAQNEAVRLALSSKFILVGDPRQLEPIARTIELKQSIFTMYGVEKIFEGDDVKNTVFLNINFRNHPHITKLVSNLFYGGMLKSGKKEDGKASLFIKRSSSKMVSTSQKSFVNHGNMFIVIEQITKALQRGRRSIGVITPYKQQALLIQENFQNLLIEYPDADIQAGTIHTFQGKEKEIIIYDITFSPSEMNGFKIPLTYNGAIKSSTAQLLNVATTRAEDFFIIVGDVMGIVQLEQNNLILKTWVEAIIDVNMEMKK